MATLVASWGEYARGAARASVQRLAGVTAAVFPEGPERDVYNNAVLERADAIDAMEAAYAAAGVERFAAWVREGDAALQAELERRGYTVAETTRAMGMALGEPAPAPPDVEVGRAGWAEYLRVDDLPPGLLARVDPEAFHVVVGHLDGAAVAVGIAYDHGGDCGSTTSGRRSVRAGAGSGRRSPRRSSATPASAAARRPASSRRRSPKACMPRSGSVISAGSWSTGRRCLPARIRAGG